MAPSFEFSQHGLTTNSTPSICLEKTVTFHRNVTRSAGRTPSVRAPSVRVSESPGRVSGSEYSTRLHARRTSDRCDVGARTGGGAEELIGNASRRCIPSGARVWTAALLGRPHSARRARPASERRTVTLPSTRVERSTSAPFILRWTRWIRPSKPERYAALHQDIWTCAAADSEGSTGDDAGATCGSARDT